MTHEESLELGYRNALLNVIKFLESLEKSDTIDMVMDYISLEYYECKRNYERMERAGDRDRDDKA